MQGGRCAEHKPPAIVVPTWDRMMRSMLADQPNLEETTTAGESVRRLVTPTFSTLSPSTCRERTKQRSISIMSQPVNQSTSRSVDLHSPASFVASLPLRLAVAGTTNR